MSQRPGGGTHLLIKSILGLALVSAFAVFADEEGSTFPIQNGYMRLQAHAQAGRLPPSELLRYLNWGGTSTFNRLFEIYQSEFFRPWSNKEERKRLEAFLTEQAIAWRASGSDAAELGFNPLERLSADIRRFVREQSVDLDKPMGFHRAEALARSTVSTRLLRSERDKQIRKLALQLEDEVDPLARQQLAVPLTDRFGPWIKETMGEIAEESMRHHLRLRRAAAQVDPDLKFMLVPAAADLNSLEGGIEISPDELLRLAPVYSREEKFPIGLAMRFRDPARDGDFRLVASHPRLQPQMVSHFNVAADETLAALMRLHTFTDPEKAKALFAIRTQADHASGLLSGTFSAWGRGSSPAEVLKHLEAKKFSYESMISYFGDRERVHDLVLAQVLHEPQKWQKRYEFLKRYGALGSSALKGLKAAASSGMAVVHYSHALVDEMRNWPADLKSFAHSIKNNVDVQAIKFGDVRANNSGYLANFFRRLFGRVPAGVAAQPAVQSRGERVQSPNGMVEGAKRVARDVAMAVAGAGVLSGVAIGAHELGLLDDISWDFFKGAVEESFRTRSLASDMGDRLVEPSKGFLASAMKWPAFAGVALVAAATPALLKKMGKSARAQVEESDRPVDALFTYRPAEGGQMPAGLEIPMRTDLTFGDSEVRTIPTEAADENVGLVHSRRPVVSLADGMVPIARPLGQALIGLRVTDANHRSLKQGSDFEVVYRPERDAYFIRLLNPEIGSVHYRAEVEETPSGSHRLDVRGTLALDDVDAQKALKEAIESSGFDRLGRQMGQRMTRGALATTGDLEALLSQSNSYPLMKGESLPDLPTDDVGKYEKFQVGGCLNGNCTVSNGFGASALNALLQAQDPELRAEVRTTLPLHQDGRALEGHVRTYVYRGDQLVDVLDFTSSNIRYGDIFRHIMRRITGRLPKPQEKASAPPADKNAVFFNWARTEGKSLLKALADDRKFLEDQLKRHRVSDQSDPSKRLYALHNLMEAVLDPHQKIEEVVERVGRHVSLPDGETDRYALFDAISAAIEREGKQIDKLYVENPGRNDFGTRRRHFNRVSLDPVEKVAPMQDVARAMASTNGQLSRGVKRCREALASVAD